VKLFVRRLVQHLFTSEFAFLGHALFFLFSLSRALLEPAPALPRTPAQPAFLKVVSCGARRGNRIFHVSQALAFLAPPHSLWRGGCFFLSSALPSRRSASLLWTTPVMKNPAAILRGAVFSSLPPVSRTFCKQRAASSFSRHPRLLSRSH